MPAWRCGQRTGRSRSPSGATVLASTEASEVTATRRWSTRAKRSPRAGDAVRPTCTAAAPSLRRAGPRRTVGAGGNVLRGRKNRIMLHAAAAAAVLVLAERAAYLVFAPGSAATPPAPFGAADGRGQTPALRRPKRRPSGNAAEAKAKPAKQKAEAEAKQKAEPRPSRRRRPRPSRRQRPRPSRRQRPKPSRRPRPRPSRRRRPRPSRRQRPRRSRRPTAEAQQKAAAEAQQKAAAEAQQKAAAEASRRRRPRPSRRRRRGPAEGRGRGQAEGSGRGQAEGRRPKPSRRRTPRRSRRRRPRPSRRRTAEAKQKADGRSQAESGRRGQAESGRRGRRRRNPKAAAEAAETALRLTPADRQRIQVALTSLGFDTHGADGVFGPRSREMIADVAARAQPTRHRLPDRRPTTGIVARGIPRDGAQAGRSTARDNQEAERLRKRSRRYRPSDPRCKSILQYSQLTGALSDEDRAYLRERCR